MVVVQNYGKSGEVLIFYYISKTQLYYILFPLPRPRPPLRQYISVQVDPDDRPQIAFTVQAGDGDPMRFQGRIQCSTRSSMSLIRLYAVITE